MVNLKIGGTTYSNVDQIQVNNSEATGVVKFMESADFLEIAQATTTPLNPKKAYFENPYLTSIGLCGMQYVSNFTTVYLPNVTTISYSSQPNGCKCINLIMPKLSTVTKFYTTGGAVQVLDFTALTTVEQRAFAGTAITSVIIRGNTVPTLNTDGHKASGVTLYVPSSMISAYQSDANWASLINGGWTITALEGSAYESTDWFKE